MTKIKFLNTSQCTDICNSSASVKIQFFDLTNALTKQIDLDIDKFIIYLQFRYMIDLIPKIHQTYGILYQISHVGYFWCISKWVQLENMT
jgi:hypothetical protein